MSARCYSCGGIPIVTEGKGEQERHVACGGLTNGAPEPSYRNCRRCHGTGVERALSEPPISKKGE